MHISVYEHGRIHRRQGENKQEFEFIDMYNLSLSTQYFPVDFRKGIGPRVSNAPNIFDLPGRRRESRISLKK